MTRCPGSSLHRIFRELRGWAVIEGNECCASGIYTCDPAAVLKVLLQGTLPLAKLTEADRRWDFEPHYYDSFAPRRGHAAILRRLTYSG